MNVKDITIVISLICNLFLFIALDSSLKKIDDLKHQNNILIGRLELYKNTYKITKKKKKSLYGNKVINIKKYKEGIR